MKTVGILLDHSTFKGVPRGRTGYESISNYNKAAKRLGLKPVYMSLAGTSVAERRVLGYIRKSSGYRLVKAPLPKVIHNRAIPKSSRQKSKLARLSRKAVVFNRARYGKFTVQRLLARGAARRYLPETRIFRQSSLEYMISRYSSLYIKPNSGGVGKGVMKISKLQASNHWSIQRRAGKANVVERRKLYKALRRMIGGKRYIVQEHIHLAQYKGKPYDVRVSVQKGSGGKWVVTGMVGKVAKAGSHVTNVARGGKVKKCEQLFRHSGFGTQEIKRRVEAVSLRIARQLDKRLPGIADLGLDIGVSARGIPYLIEVNFRDQRYSFKKAGMARTFFATYENPLKYSRYLLNKF